MNQLHEIIAKTRKAQGLSQLQLAQAAGISRASLSLLERGAASDLGYRKIQRIAARLGLELRLLPQAAMPTLDDLLEENRRG